MVAHLPLVVFTATGFDRFVSVAVAFLHFPPVLCCNYSLYGVSNDSETDDNTATGFDRFISVFVSLSHFPHPMF